jgi:hypothetical protein
MRYDRQESKESAIFDPPKDRSIAGNFWRGSRLIGGGRVCDPRIGTRIVKPAWAKVVLGTIPIVPKLVLI